MTSVDVVLHEAHGVFLAACRVADRLIDDKALTKPEREALLAEHGALVERHASLGALLSRLLQPDVAVH